MAVNKLDNSMIDPTDIGTSANQLLKLDVTAKIPAADGSLLTGLPASFTSSASDPTISTNPSGGVGTLWINTTSGETYCCTDATAGENVWINIGEGTDNIAPWVYQGETHGFVAGGKNGSNTILNIINKYAFSSSSTAGVDHGDLTSALWRPSDGHSSETYGWTSGGTYPQVSTIQRYPFASDSGAVNNGNLANVRYGHSGHSSETYGYSCEGTGPSSANIQKFSFSTNTDTAVTWGSRPGAGNDGCGISSATDGYHCGGTNDSNCYSFSFASNSGTLSSIGNLTHPRSAAAGCSSSTHGFIAGGDYTSINKSIDKFAYASSITISGHGDLGTSNERASCSGSSSVTHGYVNGGNNNIVSGGTYTKLNTILNFSFATQNIAVDVGDLTSIMTYTAGSQV